jgi:hypothetical protein
MEIFSPREPGSNLNIIPYLLSLLKKVIFGTLLRRLEVPMGWGNVNIIFI